MKDPKNGKKEKKEDEKGEEDFRLGLDFCLQNKTKEGFQHMLLAANKGHEMAQANVAVCYMQGIGVDHDLSKGITLFESLIKEKQNVIAQHNLAVCYLLGKGVQRDFETAVFLFKKAAKQGHAWSNNNLGFCHLHGLGTKKRNIEKAIKCFIEAGKTGMPESYYYLYKLYSHEEKISFIKELPKEDNVKGGEYLLLSAESGYIDAQVLLSQVLLKEKQYKAAFYFTELAAKRHHPLCEFNLASFYVNGWFVKEDQEKVVYWYRASVESGFIPGFSALGQHYYEGKGVKKDFYQAAQYLTVAAKMEMPHAQYFLGCIYLTGDGFDSNNNSAIKQEKQIMKDLNKAVDNFEKAAEQNHELALLKLIELYESEDTVLKNLEKATFYRKRLAKLYTKQGIY